MIDISKAAQLTPDLLRSFMAAVDTGSFTSAASIVHRTQAAVSMQMKRLEEDLKCTLFNREGRGVTLTSEGEILYRYSARIIELHDEALSAISVPRLNGVVKLGVPDDYATMHLPGVLKEFAINHPRVQVDVFCDSSSNLINELSNGELDLIITTDHEKTKYSASLELNWIIPERMDTQQIEILPIALFHPVCCYRDNALEALEKAGRKHRIAYGSPSLAGLLAAVQAGLAIAPVTKSTTAAGCRHALPSDGLPNIESAYIAIRFKPGKCPDYVSTFGGFIADGLGIKI